MKEGRKEGRRGWDIFRLYTISNTISNTIVIVIVIVIIVLLLVFLFLLV